MIFYRMRLVSILIALPVSLLCIHQLPTKVYAGEEQESQVLFSQDFEADQGQWLVIGAGEIKWVRDEGQARSGQGALAFTYPVAQRGLVAVATPIMPLPGARSVRCWVKSSSATVLILGAQENDGSRYICPFYAAGGKWQHIMLSFSDFVLMPDTPDENGRLDADQLIALGLLDAATLFQLPSAAEQRRTVLLDDLVISTAEVESRAKTITEGDVTLQMIDDFENPTLFWAPVRFAKGKLEFDTTAELEVERDGERVPYGAGALRYKYAIRADVAPALMTLLFKPVRGASSLRFSVKAEQPTALLVGAGERDDSRYLTFVYVPPNEWHDVVVSLNELMLAEDSRDENGRLDLDQVQSVYVADMGGLFARLIPSLAGARTIWLDRIAFSSQEEPPAQGVTEEDGQQLVWIDTCESSALRWVPLQITVQPLSIDLAEDVTFKCEEHGEGVGQGRHHLRVEYVTPPNAVTGLMHPLTAQAMLKRAVGLRLWLRSQYEVPLLIVLEERGGARYEHQITAPTGDKLQRIDIPLTDFLLSNETKDDNGMLDMDQLQVIGIADVSAALAGGGGRNVLWLDGVCFVVPAQ